MNYSKNIRKAAMAKRVVMLLCVTAFLGVAVGVVIGYSLKAHITAKDRRKEQVHINEQVDTKNFVYGAYDDRCFSEEVSLEWNAGNLDFKPLDCGMPEEQQEFVFYLCSAYNIDFTLVMALIQYESNFDPSAISITDDYGYMQINQMNHKELTEILGVTDYLDPYQNIRAGCFTLRKLFEKYQNADMVLMAYNMGEQGAERLWKQGIFSTSYTEYVFEIQGQFKEQLEGEPDEGKLEDN